MTTETTTWTVVSHGSDESAPAIAVAHLMAWLADEPSISLHTVLWAPGPTGTAPFDHGHLTDIGSAHHHPAARLLRAARLGRIAGGIAGRSVRARVRTLPTDGVLYLSTARSSALLRYLPAGDRVVITHLHSLDREEDPPLAPDRVAALVSATDVWLATDDDTRQWAAEQWGIPADDIVLMAEPVDPRSWNRAARQTDPSTLRLGLAGAAWFGSDHSARLVQRLHRLRPDLHLDLMWAHQVADPAHLAPLVHDLDHLGAGPLHMPSSGEEVLATLDEIDALAVTAPTDDGPWVVWEAAARGVPVVCFDTHPGVPSVQEGTGLVVGYPDVVAMADAVLAIHDEESGALDAINVRRAALRRRDVTRTGPQLVALAAGAANARPERQRSPS